MAAEALEITGHEDTEQDHFSAGLRASDYSVERLPNGLTRVFCRATKMVACFNPDGTYRHGGLGVLRSITEEGSSDYLTLNETLCWLDELHQREARPDE